MKCFKIILSVTRTALHLGGQAGDSITAPVAAYAARLRFNEAAYVLIQHGSYQVIDVDQQPLLDAGEVVLYQSPASAAARDAYSSASRSTVDTEWTRGKEKAPSVSQKAL